MEHKRLNDKVCVVCNEEATEQQVVLGFVAHFCEKHYYTHEYIVGHESGIKDISTGHFVVGGPPSCLFKGKPPER